MRKERDRYAEHGLIQTQELTEEVRYALRHGKRILEDYIVAEQQYEELLNRDNERIAALRQAEGEDAEIPEDIRRRSDAICMQADRMNADCAKVLIVYAALEKFCKKKPKYGCLLAARYMDSMPLSEIAECLGIVEEHAVAYEAIAVCKFMKYVDRERKHRIRHPELTPVHTLETV